MLGRLADLLLVELAQRGVDKGFLIERLTFRLEPFHHQLAPPIKVQRIGSPDVHAD
ncbi:hypothetical protein D3C79_965640 [compost metagenome]